LRVGVKKFEGCGMRSFTITVATFATLVPFLAKADDDIAGTYKLVVEQRKIVETGETVPVPNPLGYLTYGKDGRMLVLIVRHPRPKPEAIDKITDQQRADLLRTMTAYGGTYKFDGTTVEHNIDIAWNEVWAGTQTGENGYTRWRPTDFDNVSVSVSHGRKNKREHAGLGKGEVTAQQWIMSAFGPKRTCLVAPHMSAFGGKADMPFCTANVCF
jgi:Lipocalin-like domain